MTVARRVATNTAVLFIGKILSSLLSLFVAALLARHLGVEGYGKYNFVFSFLFFFQALAVPGIDSIVIRETNKNPSAKERYIANALFLKVALSIVSAILCWGMIFFAGYSPDIRFLVLLGSLQLFFGFNTIFTALFQSELKTVYYVLPELFVNILFSAFTLLLIKFNLGIAYFVALYPLNALVMTIVYASVSRKRHDIRLRFRHDREMCTILIRESWPIFLMSILITINLRLDQILIFSMADPRSLGLYATAVKLVESLNIIVTVFATSAYPLFCAAFHHSEDMFTKLYSRSFKYMSMIILPIAVGTTLLSKKILILFFGHEYGGAATALSILAWSAVFTFLGTVFYNTLLAAGNQRYNLLFTVFSTLANVLLNILLIPAFGIEGAAIASTISYGALTLPIQYFIRRTRRITAHYVLSTIKPLLCSIPMGLYAYVYRDGNAFIIIPISALIYISFIFLSKTIDREDIVYFKSIFLKESDDLA